MDVILRHSLGTHKSTCLPARPPPALSRRNKGVCGFSPLPEEIKKLDDFWFILRRNEEVNFPG